jgi:hypothetical protein
MAGVEGLEPPAPGFGDRYLRVIWGKMAAFRLNTAHHLPPIPTQKLEQVETISYSASSCWSYQLCRRPFSFACPSSWACLLLLQQLLLS